MRDTPLGQPEPGPAVTAMLLALSALALGIWAYIVALRLPPWRPPPDLVADLGAPPSWPEVVAVIPARDEARLIGRSLNALLAQEYPGRLAVVVVDDHSEDGTAAIVRALEGERVRLVAAKPLPAGWAGKLWALAEGLRRVEGEPRYLLLTDADIEHPKDSLRRLVQKAEAADLDLVSVMAELRCERPIERLLIPAFVFFFQKLYPFARVADPRARIAAAAGGCMLVRRTALERAGCLEPIRSELIDDCALARLLKRSGARIWLGFSDGVRSLRPYRSLGAIWAMVARTAYAQLRCSPALLVLTILAMAVAYLVPPLAALAYPIHGMAPAAVIGLLAWLLMAVAYLPTLRRYRQPPAMAMLLPLSAALYTAMTVDSAWCQHRGRGGAWKGRVQAAPR